ncbi:MAG: methyltransferase domain-containing protein [Alphaproteobacteria bacterium]
MEARLQRRIQRYGWDAAAGIYEDAWQTNLAPIHQQMIELAGLAPGHKVLELACGSGLLTFRAAALVKIGGSVHASDISAEMVDLVQRRALDMDCEAVTVVRGDGEVLDAPADRFQTALCSLGLMYMPDPVAALSRMHGALKPGGRAVVSTWGARQNCAWAEMFAIVDSVVKSEVCPLFFNLGAGDNLANAMTRAGFTGIALHRVQGALSFDDRAETLAAMIDAGAVALAAKSFDAATRAYVDQAFLETIADYRREDGGYDIPSEYIIAAGIKAP